MSDQGDPGDVCDFSNHPRSITEIKADTKEDCHQWTVRDSLIHILREIDSGRESWETAVIVLGKRPDLNTTMTKVRLVNTDTWTCLGMLERAKEIIDFDDR